MNHPSLRRGTGVLAVSVVVLGGLAALPVAPAAAADPAPITNAERWITGQLNDAGLMYNKPFRYTDYGLSADVGFAVAGSADPSIAQYAPLISEAIAPDVTAWYTYPVGSETHVLAGSLAKAAAFADVAGDDPTSYGGRDLVAELADRLTAQGRIADRVATGQGEADFANTIGQAFAARAFDGQGSAQTGATTTYLLAQQCDEGFFRAELGASLAADCDAAPGATPSTDTTGLAILNLLSQRDDVVVEAAIQRAAAWLVSTQKPNGAFGSDADIPAANANSTGLAGWALGEVGSRGTAARRAAVWLRAHQVVTMPGCRPYAVADQGAVAYDGAALKAADAAPIAAADRDQFRRATAQALPALASAPDRRATLRRAQARFVKAGSRQVIRGRGAPGDLTCAVRGPRTSTARVAADGGFGIRVRMPRRTTVAQFKVLDSDETLGAATYTVLGRQRLQVTAPRRADRGDRVVLTARGLVRGERATFRLRGQKVAADRANKRGTATVKVRVGGRLGPARVRVTGRFATLRHGVTTVRVTR